LPNNTQTLFGCVYYSDSGYNLLRYGAWGVTHPLMVMNDNCEDDDGTYDGETCASDASFDTMSADKGFRLILCNAVEGLFVFLPYVLMRPFFPTTRLGEVKGS
jgi:hypothetical protein